MPFVAVVFDGDVLIGPEQIGEQHAVSRKPLNVRRKVDARVELRIGNPVAAHAVGQAKMQHELGFSRGGRARKDVGRKSTGGLAPFKPVMRVSIWLIFKGVVRGYASLVPTRYVPQSANAIRRNSISLRLGADWISANSGEQTKTPGAAR